VSTGRISLRRVLSRVGLLLGRVTGVPRLRNSWLRSVTTWILRSSTTRSGVAWGNLVAAGRLLRISRRWILSRIRSLLRWVLWLLGVLRWVGTLGRRVTRLGITRGRVSLSRRISGRWVTSRRVARLLILRLRVSLRYLGKHYWLGNHYRDSSWNHTTESIFVVWYILRLKQDLTN
jgi:hypothetical protein